MADEHNTQVMRVAPPPGSAGGEAALVILYGPILGRRIPLGGAEHTLGRSNECTIPLDADSVSRRHARIVPAGGAYLLEDLGSTNGSFVNDRRVERSELNDGDIIRIGGVILKYLQGSNVEASYHEEIYRLTILDGLTQIHNQRFFHEFLEREIARASRRSSCLALVLFDIDHFKKVNDTHGHLAGDAVLKEISRRLKPRIRREDLLARYGGEEFACVLPDTTEAGARIFAEALRILIERHPTPHMALEVSVTISLGVAVADRPTLYDAKDLVRRADEKLYLAKHNGRNRVEL